MENNLLGFFDAFEKSNSGQKFGTEKCAEFIAYLAKTIPLFVDVFADGKITFWEGLGLASPAVNGARIAINIKEIASELRDLDNQEKQELINKIKTFDAFFKLSSQQIVDFIDKSADFLLRLYYSSKAFNELAEILNKK
jgi:hypothetical protein